MSTEHWVHIVDDDAAIRRSLEALLSVSGLSVRTHESAEAALSQLAPDSAGCIVIDVRMPGMNGLELQQELKRRGIDLPVIVITGHGDVPMAVAALKAGARDFLEKPFDSDVLLAAIRQALGEPAASPQSTDEQATDELDALEARFRQLTPRESEVMDLVVLGHPNKVIAHRLGIAVRTVEIHRAHVMEKTGAKNLSELVRMALRLNRAT